MHPEVKNYPIENEDLARFSGASWEVQEKISIEEWLGQFSGNTADADSAREDIDEMLLNDLGADDYHIIGVRRTIEGQGQADSSTFAVQEDGDWYVIPNIGSV